VSFRLGLASRLAPFLLAEVVQRGLGLLLLALLLHWLTADEFARYGLFTTALSLGYLLLTFTLPAAPIRLLFDRKTAEQRAELLVTIAVATMVLAALVGSIAILVSAFVVDPLTGGSLRLKLLVLAAIMSLAFHQLVATVLRAQGKGKLMVAVAVAYGGLQISSFAVLHVLGIDDIEAITLATSSALLAGAVVGLRGFGEFLLLVPPTRETLHEALDFAAPQVLHGVSLWGVSASGAWLGTLYFALEELAPYILLSLLVQVVAGVSSALFYARTPELGVAFAELDLRSARRTLRTSLWQASLLVITAYALAAVVFRSSIVPVPPGYALTTSMLLCGLVANLFHVWYLRGYSQLSFLKRTGRQSLGTVIAGAGTVGLILLLAPALGGLGLAMALALGNFLQAGASNSLAAWSERGL